MERRNVVCKRKRAFSPMWRSNRRLMLLWLALPSSCYRRAPLQYTENAYHAARRSDLSLRCTLRTFFAPALYISRRPVVSVQDAALSGFSGHGKAAEPPGLTRAHNLAFLNVRLPSPRRVSQQSNLLRGRGGSSPNPHTNTAEPQGRRPASRTAQQRQRWSPGTPAGAARRGGGVGSRQPASWSLRASRL